MLQENVKVYLYRKGGNLEEKYIIYIIPGVPQRVKGTRKDSGGP